MAVETKTFHRKTTVETAGAVDGAPDLTLAYGKVVFRPTELEIKYFRDGEGAWVIKTVTVTGRRVLKSGELGEQKYANEYWSANGMVPTAAPAWVGPLANLWSPQRLV